MTTITMNLDAESADTLGMLQTTLRYLADNAADGVIIGEISKGVTLCYAMNFTLAQLAADIQQSKIALRGA